MAVKTITIDLEAYEALSRHKGPGQSFSQVIKAHFARRRTGRELAELPGRVRLSESTLDAMEAVIRSASWVGERPPRRGLRVELLRGA